MSDDAPPLLECSQCHTLIDFSKPQKPDSHVLCPKCRYDFGTYRDVNEKYKLALKLAGKNIGPGSPTQQ